jgi:hypothetical protein
VTQAQFWRGGVKTTLGANKTLFRAHPRFWSITASTSGIEITLPDADTLLPGYPVFVIANDGSVNDFDVLDGDGNLVVTVETGKVSFLALIENTSTAGLWYSNTSPLNSVSGGGITAYPMTIGGQDTLNDVYQFAYDTDTWSLTSNNGSNNGVVAGATAIIEQDAHISGNSGGASDCFERYTPTAFTALTDDPQRRDNGGDGEELSVSDDIAYFVSGDRSFTGRNTIGYYDKSLDSHTSRTNIPTTHHSGCFLLDKAGGTDFIWAGGSLQSVTTQAATTTVRQFDSVGNSWAVLTSMGTAKMNMSKGRDPNDDMVLYCGASNSADATYYDSVHVYDISADSFSALNVYAGGTASRMGGVEVTQNGFNYLCGGTAGGSNTPIDCYEHNVAADTYSSKATHSAGSSNLRGWQRGAFAAVGI